MPHRHDQDLRHEAHKNSSRRLCAHVRQLNNDAVQDYGPAGVGRFPTSTDSGAAHTIRSSHSHSMLLTC